MESLSLLPYRFQYPAEMGKGKRSAAAIVISSSDNDEEGDLLLKSNLRNSKLKSNSKSKSASVPRTNPKRAKKAPLSSSLPRHSKNHSGFDEVSFGIRPSFPLTSAYTF